MRKIMPPCDFCHSLECLSIGTLHSNQNKKNMKTFTKKIKTIALGLSVLASYMATTSDAVAQTGGAIFTPGPTMMKAKIFPTSTLLDNGNVISFSGREYNFVSCQYSDLYSTAGNVFTETQMNYPHDASATVKLADGRFFLLGGGENLGIAPGYATTEMYDQGTGTFTPKSNMTMSRMQHAAVQLANGKVLVVGAWYNNPGAQNGELYDTMTNTFTPTGALNDPRAQPVVFPTTDGGAIVTGGWPSYGGSVKTTVEYYSAVNNTFATQSTELIPADPGWVPMMSFTRLVSDSKMSNGKYLMMASRNITMPEYAILEFDPDTKLFTKMNTSSPLRDSLTDGGFSDFVLNKNDNMAYLIGFDSGYDPQRVCIVTVNLSTGDVFHPTTTYTLPSAEYFYASYTYIPSNGKILVMGINGGNSSYFTGTNKTYLLTPQMTVGTTNLTRNNLDVTCYPNPAFDKLYVNLNSLSAGIYTLELNDMLGRTCLREVKQASSGEQKWSLHTADLQPGMYVLSVKSGEKRFIQQVMITK